AGRRAVGAQQRVAFAVGGEAEEGETGGLGRVRRGEVVEAFELDAGRNRARLGALADPHRFRRAGRAAAGGEEEQAVAVGRQEGGDGGGALRPDHGNPMGSPFAGGRPEGGAGGVGGTEEETPSEVGGLHVDRSALDVRQDVAAGAESAQAHGPGGGAVGSPQVFVPGGIESGEEDSLRYRRQRPVVGADRIAGAGAEVREKMGPLGGAVGDPRLASADPVLAGEGETRGGGGERGRAVGEGAVGAGGGGGDGGGGGGGGRRDLVVMG